MGRILRASLYGVLVVLLVPPGWSVARDAFLLIRAPADKQEEARFIIQRDIIRASNRALEVRGLLKRLMLVPVSGPMPVIQPVMPPVDLTKKLPTCDEPVQGGVRIPRALLIDEARFRGTDRSLSALQLIGLNACVSATLFARSCADAFYSKQKAVNDEQLVVELAALGAVRQQGRYVCWTPAIERPDPRSFATLVPR